VHVADAPGELTLSLVSLRLFPLTPQWLLTLVSPMIHVPVGQHALTFFVGTLPYTFVCCQAGAVLGTLGSLGDVFSTRILLQLSALAAAIATPLVWRRWLRARNPHAHHHHHRHPSDPIRVNDLPR
jgi:uncharacterized membrane protein YdjX (TVP38/TMEM64 family)